jgi:hypothetical protein
LTTRSPELFSDDTELASGWIDAGFQQVSAVRIEVRRRYRYFDEFVVVDPRRLDPEHARSESIFG